MQTGETRLWRTRVTTDDEHHTSAPVPDDEPNAVFLEGYAYYVVRDLDSP